MTTELLKTSQAAEYLGLSKPTLERYRTFGGGPRFAKLGKAVRYRKCDLDDWLVARLVRSTSEAV